MVNVSDSRKRGEENEAEEKGSSVVIKKIKTTCRSVKDHGGRGEEKKMKKKEKKTNVWLCASKSECLMRVSKKNTRSMEK